MVVHRVRWSILKSQVERFFAPSVAGHVELRATCYRKNTNDDEGRAWITLDKEEVWSSDTLSHWSASWQLARDIREANGCTDLNDPGHLASFREAGRRADEILHRQGSCTLDEFYEALKEYRSFTLVEALEAKHVHIRGLAMLDRRLGKRRLKTLELKTDEHEFVRRMYDFRCECEGLGPGPARNEQKPITPAPAKRRMK